MSTGCGAFGVGFRAPPGDPCPARTVYALKAANTTSAADTLPLYIVPGFNRNNKGPIS